MRPLTSLRILWLENLRLQLQGWMAASLTSAQFSCSWSSSKVSATTSTTRSFLWGARELLHFCESPALVCTLHCCPLSCLASAAVQFIICALWRDLELSGLCFRQHSVTEMGRAVMRAWGDVLGRGHAQELASRSSMAESPARRGQNCV